MRDLMSPQIMLNKFSELAVEQTAKMGNGAIMYEEGAIAEPKINIWKRIRSTVGAMLPVVRIDGVKEIEGKGPPPQIMNFIQHWLMILQKIPRRFDSSNGGTAYQGESGKHAEALQAAAHGNLSTATELIEDALAEVFEQYIELIAQFYSQDRIGRVLNKPVTIGRSYLLSYAPTEYDTGNMIADPATGEEVPELKQVKEEYVPNFDIKVNIGVERPMDREYWVNLAFTLFQTIDPMTQQPMIDVQAVQYTITNGRMEPFEVIDERMKKEQMIMQQMEQLQAQNEQLTNENQVMQDMLVEAEENNMGQSVEALKAIQQDDDRQHQRQMDVDKMDIERQKVAQMGQRKMVGTR
jgi:hypothetical protein